MSSDTTRTQKHHEMAQVTYTPPSPPQQPSSAMSPRDEILRSLLATAAKQHTPIAPSPLNPKQCASDIILGRHINQLRKTRTVTRRPPEISPTLRFLKRKAYFEYQAHKRAGDGGSRGGGTVLVETDVGSADVTDCCEDDAEDEEESMPAALIVESGSLLHVVQFDYARQSLAAAAADMEKGLVARRPPPRWQSPRQRLRFFLVLCFVSTCLTMLTVFSLGALKTDRYLPS